MAAADKIQEFGPAIMEVFHVLCTDDMSMKIAEEEAATRFANLLNEVGMAIGSAPAIPTDSLPALIAGMGGLSQLCDSISIPGKDHGPKDQGPMCNVTSAAKLMEGTPAVCSFADSPAFAAFLDGGMQDVWSIILDSVPNVEALCANTPCLEAMADSCLAGEVSMMMQTYCACHIALPADSVCKSGILELAVTGSNIGEMMISPSSDTSFMEQIQAVAAKFCPDSAADAICDEAAVKATPECDNDLVAEAVGGAAEAVCCYTKLFDEPTCLQLVQLGDGLDMAFMAKANSSDYMEALGSLEDPSLPFEDAVASLNGVGIETYGDLVTGPIKAMYCDTLSDLGLDPAALSKCGPKLACFEDEEQKDEHDHHGHEHKRHLLDGHGGGGQSEEELGLEFLSTLCAEDSCVNDVLSSCMSTRLEDLQALFSGVSGGIAGGSRRRSLLDGHGDHSGDDEPGLEGMLGLLLGGGDGAEAILGILGPLLTPLCSQSCKSEMSTCQEAALIPGLGEMLAAGPMLEPACAVLAPPKTVCRPEYLLLRSAHVQPALALCTFTTTCLHV